MESWIYLFSHFTSEALLFEALIICFLVALYAIFYILRKRKLGTMENTVPSSVVKSYLNILIADAHELRTQLFGLLAQAGALPPGRSIADLTQIAPTAGAPKEPTVTPLAPEAAAQIAQNPDIQNKLGSLEGKIAEQAKAYEALLAEKSRIEAELSAAKAGAAGGAPAAGGNPGELEELRKKIKSLEERLAEYSVIEDDLANLKRLQQENAQLKASMKGGDGAAAATAAVAAAASTAAAAVAAPAAPAAPATPKDQFEELASTVEQSLKTEVSNSLAAAAAAAPAPAAAAPVATPAASPVEAAPAGASAPPVDPAAAAGASPMDQVGGKSDEDLLSEFEKMLNA